MEDNFKFLLIAAVAIIGLVNQVRKGAKKKAGEGSTMPNNPLPENWGGETYGGFIPEGPKPTATPEKKKKTTAKHKSPLPESPTPTNPVIEMPPENESEFAINSVEEARRAIIWSEILQRKY